MTEEKSEWTLELKINGIYALRHDCLEEHETITKGTPLKIISKHQFGKFVVCEDYKANKHYITTQYFNDKKIEKYPNYFLVLLMKTINFLSIWGDDVFYWLRSLLAFIGLIGSIVVLAITNISDNYICSHLMLLALLLLFAFALYPFELPIIPYSPLYEKNNLKQLKTLLQRSDRQTERL